MPKSVNIDAETFQGVVEHHLGVFTTNNDAKKTLKEWQMEFSAYMVEHWIANAQTMANLRKEVDDDISDKRNRA